MQIQDIVNKIYKDTKTDSTSYPAADMLIDINNAYNRVVSLILRSDNKWQWEDFNNADLPIATTALVANQQDYALAVSHLKILKAELKNNAGTWIPLSPRDGTNDSDSALSYESTITGVPEEYDKLGNSIFLYPVPSYSQSASLKLYFQRGPAEFTSAEVSTGTKLPGFNPLYHELIPLWVCHEFWMTNSPTTSDRFLQKITMLEDILKKDYGARDKDEHQFISNAPINYM